MPQARSRALGVRSARCGGTAALQRFGEGSAYATAALAFFATMVVMLSYQPPVERPDDLP